MLPIIPYTGMLRPALILLAIILMILILNLTRTAKWHKKLLVVTFFVYLILLIYATFLSRSVSNTLSYRLSLLGAARDSFSLEGGLSQVLPRLIQGDFSGISLTSPRSLEGILINILIFIPLGYLLPIVFPKHRWHHVICIGFATTVSIEVVQLFTKLGMFDLDDILNNVIGTIVGVTVHRVIGKRIG